MTRSYLVVIDMQHDFIDGALGTPEAQRIVSAVIRKAERFPGTIIFTQDTHGADYLSTQEGAKLPIEHCIEGTPGWELEDRLAALQRKRNAPVYRKSTFGSIELARDLARENEIEPLESIELVGLCTDICVASNALLLKAFLPETTLSVDASCCAGVTPKAHEAALRTMESCQIEVKREAGAIEAGTGGYSS